jgi:hypothetical protein
MTVDEGNTMKHQDDVAASGTIECFRCGKQTSHGRRVAIETDERPARSWLGFALGIVPGLLLREATAKSGRQFAYSLCPHCLRVRRSKQATAIVLWAVWLVTVVMAAVTRNTEVWGGLVFLLFIAAVVATALSVTSVDTPKSSYRRRM